jgi:2C-methyl-D-erythritol 2,4-cyclodiphosphate synthase
MAEPHYGWQQKMNREEYLDLIRKRNKEIMSKCFYCNNFSITIQAEAHELRPVCKEHNTRSLDEIESDMNIMFEKQVDFE